MRKTHTDTRTDSIHTPVFVFQVTFLMMPLEIGWNVTVTWQAGDSTCRIMSFFRTFGLYLSSFVIVSISLDRLVQPIILSAVSIKLITYPPVPAIPIILPAVSVWPTIHPAASAVTINQPTVSVWPTIHPAVSVVMINHPNDLVWPTIHPNVSLATINQPTVSVWPMINPTVAALPIIHPSSAVVPLIHSAMHEATQSLNNN